MALAQYCAMETPPLKPRKAEWAFLGLGPGGKEWCRCGCGNEVPPGRRQTTCSTACIEAWRLRNDPKRIRWVVFDRDHGICAHCGTDTEKLLNECRKASYRAGRSYRLEPPPGFPAVDRNWWEADHIVPVIEGGGQCGPEGYRTLCIPCHKLETAALARRRAERRRAAAQASQPTLEL